jgi:hypothetical protein
MANIYSVCNGVSNDVYKYDFSFVENCNSYNVFSYIVYLDHKGKLIDRVKIPGNNSAHISLRDDTIQCTDWKTNTIYCYTLTGQVYETSNGVPENLTMSFSYFPLLENINNRLPS